MMTASALVHATLLLSPQSPRASARAAVRLLEINEPVVYLGAGAALAGLLLALQEGNEPEDDYDRTRASKLPATSAALHRAGTTPEGAALLPVLTTDGFPAAWAAEVQLLSAKAASTASAEASSLQARIAAVQGLTRHFAQLQREEGGSAHSA